MSPEKTCQSAKKRQFEGDGSQFRRAAKKDKRSLDAKAAPRNRGDGKNNRVELSISKPELSKEYAEKVHDSCCRDVKNCGLYESYLMDDGETVDSTLFSKYCSM